MEALSESDNLVSVCKCFPLCGRFLLQETSYSLLLYYYYSGKLHITEGVGWGEGAYVYTSVEVSGKLINKW